MDVGRTLPRKTLPHGYYSISLRLCLLFSRANLLLPVRGPSPPCFGSPTHPSHSPYPRPSVGSPPKSKTSSPLGGKGSQIISVDTQIQDRLLSIALIMRRSLEHMAPVWVSSRSHIQRGETRPVAGAPWSRFCLNEGRLPQGTGTLSGRLHCE